MRPRTASIISIVPNTIVSVAFGTAASDSSTPSSPVSGSLFAFRRPTQRTPWEPCAPVKTLDDRARSAAGGTQRLAPAGQRRIAVEQRLRIAQALVEHVVHLDDRKTGLTSFHLKRRPMDIYCARATLLSL